MLREFANDDDEPDVEDEEEDDEEEEDEEDGGLLEGSRVECNFGGKGTKLSGKISRVRPDGIFSPFPV